MRKSKSNNTNIKANSSLIKNAVGITLSSVISIIILVLLTALVSLFLLKSETVSESYIMYFYFCSAVSSFIGGFISSKRTTFKGIFSGLIASVAYNFLLTIILLFVSVGQIRANTGILYLLSTVFFVLGGIVAANTKRRK
ncbi:MAG: TIGR04086 family membrane protein [Oscillospiraceae bacterium]|nr:TIGR04086 family membrane protein [Oscillospiraceae bacterium]